MSTSRLPTSSGLGHDILKPTVDELRALAAASSRTTSRDVLQAKLNAIADRLAPYVVE